MTRMRIATIALLLLGTAVALEPGQTFAVSAGAGVQGIFSMFEAGVQFPKINQRFGFGLKARYLSSLTYATYIDSAGDYVSFHPCVVGGALTMGGCSPVYQDLLRAYGNFEILLGHSFTPWDDMVVGTGNLLGDNLTWMASGFFGLEVFTSKRTGVYLEAGGGFKSIKGDEENRYVQTSAWLGSGVTLRMGVNLYF
jgi:hypothetical protein